MGIYGPYMHPIWTLYRYIWVYLDLIWTLFGPYMGIYRPYIDLIWVYMGI